MTGFAQRRPWVRTLPPAIKAMKTTSTSLIVLALLCLAALNLQQRWTWFELEDGVLWKLSGGAVVASDIAGGTAADRAGLRRGDILDAIDGHEVTAVDDVVRALHAATSGERLRYTVVRLKTREQLDIAVAPVPSSPLGLYCALAAVGIFSLLVGASVRVRRPDHQATLHFFWLTVAFFGMTAFSFTGRLTSDPPLPIGFEDQLFATLRDGSGNTITTTFTWKSETPALATIDANGVMHALAEGTAIFRATAAEGTTATFSLPMAVATASTTAAYGNNTEFGDPTDADATDDFIVRRPQYTTSFNKNRGTPNWVSYDLEATHFGSEDRCDCFTFDPSLPAAFTRYTTADYTGAGAAAGFGIDRGHLARSFDRTSASLDNAFTFLFTNIVPQAADLNQGPWAAMENFLGDLARLQNKEVYIVAGVAGNIGTVKNEGKIVIPASTWKVAVIMPRNQGLSDIKTLGDLEVIAVIMPNRAGVRNVDWQTYKTTVDAVEALSGYDLLALLRDDIEKWAKVVKLSGAKVQ